MSYFCFMEVILIPAKPKEVKKQKLRVAAYCRVSSADPEQIASLESQVYYYERKIKSNKSWLYRGVYYDVGSGLRTEQRKGLAKMLRQAEKGKIDLILTKSISRLARNTVDAIYEVFARWDESECRVIGEDNRRACEPFIPRPSKEEMKMQMQMYDRPPEMNN